MNVFLPYISKTLIVFLLLFIFESAHSQKVIAVDSIEFNTEKGVFYFLNGEQENFLFLKDKMKFSVFVLNKDFKRKSVATYNLSNIIEGDKIIGAAHTGNSVTILFSNKSLTTFCTVNFFPEKGIFSKGCELTLSDFDYLNWFIYKNQMVLLTSKRESSILSTLLIDSLNRIHERIFDLSGERLETLDYENLHQMLLMEKYSYVNDAIFGKDNPVLVQRIETDRYLTELDTKEYCKLYQRESGVCLTINKTNYYTYLIEINLDKNDYKFSRIPYKIHDETIVSITEGNSFLSENILVTAFKHLNSFGIGIYDLIEHEYIKTWDSTNDSLKFYNTSTFFWCDVEDTIVKEIKQEKFIEKINKADRISVAVNRNADNTLDLVLGGLYHRKQFFATSWTSGSPMPLGPNGMMFNNFNSIPLGNSLPPYYALYDYQFYSLIRDSHFSLNRGESSVKTHAFFQATLDYEKLVKVKQSSSSNRYSNSCLQFNKSLTKDIRSHHLSVYQNDKYYMGFYQKPYYIFCEMR